MISCASRKISTLKTEQQCRPEEFKHNRAIAICKKHAMQACLREHGLKQIYLAKPNTEEMRSIFEGRL